MFNSYLEKKTKEALENIIDLAENETGMIYHKLEINKFKNKHKYRITRKVE